MTRDYRGQAGENVGRYYIFHLVLVTDGYHEIEWDRWVASFDLPHAGGRQIRCECRGSGLDPDRGHHNDPAFCASKKCPYASAASDSWGEYESAMIEALHEP